MPQKRRVPPIVWTILFILLLAAAAATPYAKTVELVLMFVQFLVVIAASIVMVRMYWKYWHRTGDSNPQDTVVQRVRNWGMDRR